MRQPQRNPGENSGNSTFMFRGLAESLPLGVFMQKTACDEEMLALKEYAVVTDNGQLLTGRKAWHNIRREELKQSTSEFDDFVLL